MQKLSRQAVRPIRRTRIATTIQKILEVNGGSRRKDAAEPTEGKCRSSSSSSNGGEGEGGGGGGGDNNANLSSSEGSRLDQDDALSRKPRKRRETVNWTKDTTLRAILERAVEENLRTGKTAETSRKYNIPKRTLRRYTSKARKMRDTAMKKSAEPSKEDVKSSNPFASSASFSFSSPSPMMAPLMSFFAEEVDGDMSIPSLSSLDKDDDGSEFSFVDVRLLVEALDDSTDALARTPRFARTDSVSSSSSSDDPTTAPLGKRDFERGATKMPRKKRRIRKTEGYVYLPISRCL